MPIRISVVTPSFNQGQYLEQTIHSILDQNFPNLEYVIVDGGSTDQSVDIIRKYASQLTYWCSTSDEGQYDALNKGFAQTTGEVMCWLNSDDMHVPWSLQIVSEIFSLFPQVEWLTSGRPMTWDPAGRAVYCRAVSGFDSAEFYRGEYCADVPWYGTGWIQQESTFWRRSLWERAGGTLNTTYHFAADFDLWARFFQSANLYTVHTPLGGFRIWKNQISNIHRSSYIAEARRILASQHTYPYNYGESLLRRVTASIPRPLALKLRLVRGYKICLYYPESEEWQIVTR